jgi:hypothetical protein
MRAIPAENAMIEPDTVKLRRTKLGTLRLLWLGRIIENQNSDFVTV